MTVIPLFDISDLEYGVVWAKAVYDGQLNACEHGCDDDTTYCEDCGTALDAVALAEARLDAARSQRPERHISAGCAGQRRLERAHAYRQGAA